MAETRPRSGGGGGGKTVLIVVLVIVAIVCVCCGGAVGTCAYTGYQAAKPMMDVVQNTQAAAQQNPWSEHPEDVIDPDRLDAYLTIREAAVESFRENIEAIEAFQASQRGGNQNVGFWDAIDMVAKAFEGLRVWSEGLKTNGMNPREFWYITDQVYGTWYANREDAPEQQSDYQAYWSRVFTGGVIPEKNLELFEANREKIDELAEYKFERMMEDMNLDQQVR